MRGDAVLAGAQDRVAPVDAVQRGAAAARHALVARGPGVAEVRAAHLLHQVAAHRRHVAQLGRRAEEQGLGKHREAVHDCRGLCDVANAGQRPDAQTAPGARSRTSRMAARMLGQAAQRHRLPLIHSAISVSDSACPSSSSATADMIWPGVQYPHWKASCSQNARCIGCSSSPSASPSIVVTSRPSHVIAGVRHASTLRPSTHTVQAPQVPFRLRGADGRTRLEPRTSGARRRRCPIDLGRHPSRRLPPWGHVARMQCPAHSVVRAFALVMRDLFPCRPPP